MKKTPIEKAVEILGSQSALARALKVSRMHVCTMVATGRVPAKQCKKIEKATDRQVTAEQLRPDIFKAA